MNPYGHPHDELIKRLEEVKSEIHTTADKGAITIRTDGHIMEIKGYLD